MKKKSVVRIYNVTDADLVQLADKLLAAANRDATEMLQRGYTTTRLQDIHTLRDNFDVFAPDDFYLGAMVSATEDKDLVRNDLETRMRTIMLMAENRFGADSGNYKRFGDNALSRMTDEQLLRNGKLVHQTANFFQNDLASEGLTPTILSDFKAACQKLDDKIDAQNIAKTERDVATEERVEKGNLLYEALQKLGKVGKDIWYTSNEAKYNDYLISESNGHDSGGSTPSI